MRYLGNISAGKFWNSPQRDVISKRSFSYADNLSSCPHECDGDERLLACGIVKGIACDFGRMYFNVPSKDLRVRRDLFDYSVYKRRMPECSYVIAAEGICIASPELSVIQLANTLTVFQLAQYICELSGKYSLSWDDECRVLKKAAPVTSIEKCRAFCEEAKGMYGIQKARRAITYATNLCASPLETELFLLLTLDTRLGGYGLPIPQMNEVFDVPWEYRNYLQQGSISPDMLWGNVALEYDSRMTHSSYEQATRDAKRSNVLSALGISSMSVRADDVRNVEAIERVVDILSAKLELPLCDKGHAVREKRLQLLRELRDYSSGSFLDDITR